MYGSVIFFFLRNGEEIPRASEIEAVSAKGGLTKGAKPTSSQLTKIQNTKGLLYKYKYKYKYKSNQAD